MIKDAGGHGASPAHAVTHKCTAKKIYIKRLIFTLSYQIEEYFFLLLKLCADVLITMNVQILIGYTRPTELSNCLKTKYHISVQGQRQQSSSVSGL